MKKIIILLFATILAIGTISAQERVVFYSGSIPVHSQNIDYVDSVNFVNGITIVHNNIGETNFQFPVVGIDSIVFAEEEPQVDTGEIIYITYAGSTVSVINPWANRGVTVTTTGADVTVNAVSGQQDIIYYLSGTTTDGSLTISSDHRFNMTLDGVSITNPTGAAIKSLLDEKINLTLKNTSTLADGATSTDKAPFDSRGQVIISGNGTLNLNGTVKHGLFSADYIRVLSGTVNVTGAANDGIHSNDYVEIFGGTITVNNAKSGIDAGSRYLNISGGSITVNSSVADGKGLKSDSLVTITGGTINLTMSGDYAKGIKAGTDIDIQGGTITINGSGATVVTAGDPSHCAGLKSNGNTIISSLMGNTDLHVTMASGAAGGKAINADGNVVINGGTLELSVAGAGGNYTDTNNTANTYSSHCIKTNGAITVNGGDLILTAAGRDSKCLAADQAVTVNGGTIGMTISGQASKGIKSDLSVIIENGDITANVSGATVVANQSASNSIAIKSDGTMEINGGTINATCTSASGGAKCLSSDGNMTFNGGNLTLSTAGMGATVVGSGTSCTDGYAPSCIKSDGNITINGGDFNCQSTGKGGRGIACDGILTIGTANTDNDLIHIYIQTSGAAVNASSGGGGFPGGGSSSDYWKGLPKGIKAQGNIYIHSGHVQSYCAQTSGDPTGEAIESKDGIYINGGFVEANAYDDAINCANHIEVNGGYVWAYSRGNDAIDCNGAYSQFNGGIVIAAGREEAIDANCDGMGGTQGHLQINGATIVAYRASSGGGGMALLDSPTYMNGQKYLSPSNITTGNRYCIKNSGGDPVMILNHQAVSGNGFMTSTSGLRPPGGGGSSASFIFTSPEVTSGTYTLYTNPTINGTANWHGLYVGASATTSGSGTSLTAQ